MTILNSGQGEKGGRRRRRENNELDEATRPSTRHRAPIALILTNHKYRRIHMVMWVTNTCEVRDKGKEKKQRN